jgi:pyruvate/2-oxoglutarate dehydrogenase complex dihydrolipoamide acyltransferase (E2) component
VVVQEDTENCSVGQMVITHVASKADLWDGMLSPPTLISKGNVMIGYNPIYEYAALPDVDRIVGAIRRSASTKATRKVSGVSHDMAAPTEKKATAETPATAKTSPAKDCARAITVPIMGEGIRAAKVVSLLKNSGDPIELDDALCEVETDKAVYPIESSFAGVMGEWKTKVGDTVEIGQDLGTILTGEFAEQPQKAAGAPAPHHAANGSGKTKFPNDRGAAVSQHFREPALSATITRKLSRVVPANLQIDAQWEAIRKARDTAKKSHGKNAASPSVMIAWAVVRAMETHSGFRRLVLEDDQIVEHENFDLGIAVALDGDRLATAVVTEANLKSWDDFILAYHNALAATRSGRVDAMNAPVVISSLGAFGVRAAAPIVVPPSVATLFVGTAHNEVVANGKKRGTAEVVTLSLTFDHRVVNGAGAANFAHAIKEQIEHFNLPAKEPAAK